MEAVITYVRGRPKETKLTYRRIDDDVVEKIVLNGIQKQSAWKQKHHRHHKNKSFSTYYKIKNNVIKKRTINVW